MPPSLLQKRCYGPTEAGVRHGSRLAIGRRHQKKSYQHEEIPAGVGGTLGARGVLCQLRIQKGRREPKLSVGHSTALLLRCVIGCDGLPFEPDNGGPTQPKRWRGFPP